MIYYCMKVFHDSIMNSFGNILKYFEGYFIWAGNKSIYNNYKSQKLVITSDCAQELGKLKVLRCNVCVFGFVIFVLLFS